MNNTYPIGHFQMPVNNYCNWSIFNDWGMCLIANDNVEIRNAI